MADEKYDYAEQIQRGLIPSREPLPNEDVEYVVNGPVSEYDKVEMNRLIACGLIPPEPHKWSKSALAREQVYAWKAWVLIFAGGREPINCHDVTRPTRQEVEEWLKAYAEKIQRSDLRAEYLDQVQRALSRLKD
jgi:hypothetical protein